MSVTSRVQTQIKDSELLKKTLSDLQYKFESNVKDVSFWNGGKHDLDLYVRSHKFGFRQQEDGVFELIADSDYRKEYNKVMQKYSENKVRDEIKKKGFKVAGSEVLPDGRIKLTVKKLAYG